MALSHSNTRMQAMSILCSKIVCYYNGLAGRNIWSSGWVCLFKLSSQLTRCFCDDSNTVTPIDKKNKNDATPLFIVAFPPNHHFWNFFLFDIRTPI
ncbi:hypothetical protein RJT34_33165 [Clitoria ternatea]|uniref:Uncharacterized protein n=1 Tax=Clitoria ternatea TaxID=43366 RepID=A0AAN9F1I4_CLITE